MTNRQTRFLLRSGSAVLAIASVGVLVWAARGPSIDSPKHQVVSAPSKSPASDDRVLRPLSDFTAVWSRPLSRPLQDPPPVAKPPQKPSRERASDPSRTRAATKGPGGLALLGTVLESGNSLAVLAESGGSLRVCRVGDTIANGGATLRVERIEFDQVTLAGEGRPLILSMPPARAR
ncbi:MAG: type II secretion system protein N [Planctomycetota bacterium]